MNPTPTVDAATLELAPASFAATAKRVAAATHFGAECSGDHHIELAVGPDGTIVAFEDIVDIELKPTLGRYVRGTHAVPTADD